VREAACDHSAAARHRWRQPSPCTSNHRVSCASHTVNSAIGKAGRERRVSLCDLALRARNKGGHIIGSLMRRAFRYCWDREFADSPLEGTGFELAVPPS
jgi:hypothetical protein